MSRFRNQEVLIDILNVAQEWKAEKTVAALASVGAPVAQVVRDGREIDSRVEEVVP